MKLKICSCINCGSFLFLRNCLCDSCYKAIVQRFRNKEPLNIQGHFVQSLLKWNPGESDTLSSLIHILKLNQKELWKSLSYEFIKNNNFEFQSDSVLISLQSTSKLHTHAQDWGDSLSNWLGCPHVVALKKSDQELLKISQREKSKIERRGVELVPIVDISNLVSRNVIFVDDIVTTGATLKAAFEALGRPDRFHCWSMAVRTTGSIAENDV